MIQQEKQFWRLWLTEYRVYHTNSSMETYNVYPFSAERGSKTLPLLHHVHYSDGWHGIRQTWHALQQTDLSQVRLLLPLCHGELTLPPVKFGEVISKFAALTVTEGNVSGPLARLQALDAGLAHHVVTLGARQVASRPVQVPCVTRQPPDVGVGVKEPVTAHDWREGHNINNTVIPICVSGNHGMGRSDILEAFRNEAWLRYFDIAVTNQDNRLNIQYCGLYKSPFPDP